jgi:hypothetical protein
LKCSNHPEETAWYYMKILPQDKKTAQFHGAPVECELKVLLCLACTEAARDMGWTERLFEVPYGAERKAKL